ncbi:MAG: hypothetical protein J6X10_02075 [Bacteroidales bacterium]|nr:hypothetical protein [Bacteroidales bacterium]
MIRSRAATRCRLTACVMLEPGETVSESVAQKVSEGFAHEIVVPSMVGVSPREATK